MERPLIRGKSLVVLDFDLTETIPRRLESLAARLPNHLAIKGRDRSFTYAELDAYANGIAAQLLSVSNPGARVILFLEHGAQIVAAILGVLKAGQVYVPIDPKYPRARNELILDDADASIILTNDALYSEAKAMAYRDETVINLDVDEVNASAERNASPIAPESPACLIYTSGSTGRPKGVVHTHQTILHNADRRSEIQKITPADRMTLLYSCSVGGALHGMFTTLMSGASLYPNSIYDESVPGLVRWLRREKITIYHSVATLFRELAAQFQSGATCPHMRLVIFGGERALRADAESVWEFFPEDCKVYAGLGTTETGSIRGWTIDRNSEYEGNVLPSGYPLADVDLQIIGNEGESLGAGREGEIVVTSRFLYDGYWRDPQSTLAVMSQDPEDPTLRTYRTGDRGVLLPDGRLVLSARMDAQLSIRGFRVETGEIESAFLNHPEVMNAAVIVCDRNSPDPVLSAFVQPEPGTQHTGKEFRRYAQEQLPSYMVPTHYVILEELPTTPNGKTDRKLLESYEVTPLADANEYAEPRDELETRLVEVFLTEMHVEWLGIHTDFFEVGLTSIMAVQILTKIEVEMGFRIPLHVLFKAPTVAMLVERIRAGNDFGESTEPVTLNVAGSRPPLMCFPGIGGVAMFTFRRLAEHVGQDQPFHALQLQGIDGDDLGHRTLEEMAAHQIEVIRGIQPEGPYYLLGYSFGGRLAFEMANQLLSSGEEIALLGLIDSAAPGYPNVAPLPKRLKLHLQMLRPMTMKERIAYLRERWRRMVQHLAWRDRQVTDAPNMEDRPLDERIDYLLTITERVSKGYKPPIYPGTMTLFRASDKPNWLGSSFDDQENGWGMYTREPVDVHLIPGAHLDILEDPNVEALAREIRTCLDGIHEKNSLG